jgi:drug/metabolite transporter (DMT)-like permease
MKLVWNSAFALLVITGALLGLSLPFGKIATANGIPPIVWAFLISFGAGAVLLAALVITGHRLKLSAHKLRYFFVAALVSYAIPNLLMFSLIPHVGAGYAGIMYTLSPVVTLVFSLLLGVRRPNLLGIAGIVVGFVGAVMVALTRGEADRPADLFWVVLGLILPLFLACGNIYRTYDWPKGSGPIELAAGCHLAAALMLLIGAVGTGAAGGLGGLADLPLLSLAQVVTATAMFVVFFRLQDVGGPVYLSQIGYVAAAIALVSGTLFLGEHYQWLTWLGAGIITTGVVMTTRAQNRKA